MSIAVVDLVGGLVPNILEPAFLNPVANARALFPADMLRTGCQVPHVAFQHRSRNLPESNPNAIIQCLPSVPKQHPTKSKVQDLLNL